MANKKIPMRQCIGCGEMKPKKEMIRVIKTGEDEIILDKPVGKMAEVHTFARKANVCRKQLSVRD